MNPARCDDSVTVCLRVCYATVTWKVLPRLSLVARVDEGVPENAAKKDLSVMYRLL